MANMLLRDLAWILVLLTIQVSTLPALNTSSAVRSGPIPIPRNILIPGNFHVTLDRTHAEPLTDLELTSKFVLGILKELSKNIYATEIYVDDRVDRRPRGSPHIVMLMRGEESARLQTRYQHWAVLLCYQQVADAIRSRGESPTCEFGFRNDSSGNAFDQKLGMLQFVSLVPPSNAVRGADKGGSFAGISDVTLSRFKMTSVPADWTSPGDDTHPPSSSSTSPPLSSRAIGTSNETTSLGLNESSFLDIETRYVQYSAEIEDSPTGTFGIVEEIVLSLGYSIIQLASRDQVSRQNELELPQRVRFWYSEEDYIWVTADAPTDMYRPMYSDFLSGMVAVFEGMQRRGRYGSCDYKVFRNDAFSRWVMKGEVTMSQDEHERVDAHSDSDQVEEFE